MAWGEDGSWHTLDGSGDHYCLQWVGDDGEEATSAQIYPRYLADFYAQKFTREWKTPVTVKDLEAFK